MPTRDTIRSQGSVICPAGLDMGLECAGGCFSDGGRGSRNGVGGKLFQYTHRALP